MALVSSHGDHVRSLLNSYTGDNITPRLDTKAKENCGFERGLEIHLLFWSILRWICLSFCFERSDMLH